MNYTELSLEKLKEVSIEAANKIASERKIDLIIYIAKAGFPIAFYMNEVFQCQLLGIGAQRKGNKMKQFLAPVISCMPRFVRDMLISIELKSKVHKKDIERHVEFHESIKKIDPQLIDTILVVDDSVDTGHSMVEVVKRVKEKFTGTEVVSYSLNVWKQSEELFKTDYLSYIDTVIRAPMSKDSKEYKVFCNMYEKETQNGYV